MNGFVDSSMLLNYSRFMSCIFHDLYTVAVTMSQIDNKERPKGLIIAKIGPHRTGTAAIEGWGVGNWKLGQVYVEMLV